MISCLDFSTIPKITQHINVNSLKYSKIKNWNWKSCLNHFIEGTRDTQPTLTWAVSLSSPGISLLGHKISFKLLWEGQVASAWKQNIFYCTFFFLMILLSGHGWQRYSRWFEILALQEIQPWLPVDCWGQLWPWIRLITYMSDLISSSCSLRWAPSLLCQALRKTTCMWVCLDERSRVSH